MDIFPTIRIFQENPQKGIHRFAQMDTDFEKKPQITQMSQIGPGICDDAVIFNFHLSVFNFQLSTFNFPFSVFHFPFFCYTFTMKKALIWLKNLFKKDIMLSVSILAALISLFITPPSKELLHDINWRTLATLFMLLSVLEGFKSENIFEPILRKAGQISSIKLLTVFLVFGVFFTSMFVTNDVSLIIFVPLTIILFRSAGKEKVILPVLTFENIAAIRGSLLMPFGSPQNLFLYAKSGISTPDFILMMLPLWIFSAILLFAFISLLYFRKKESTDLHGFAQIDADGKKPQMSQMSQIRNNGKESTDLHGFAQIDADGKGTTDVTERKKIHRLAQINTDYDSSGEAASDTGSPEGNPRRRLMYQVLFLIVVASIVSRTRFYPLVLALVFITLLIGDRKILLKTDYVLLLTFLCFFTFSSSICRHPAISGFLMKSVAGHEYLWSILLSQLISNVPASIVLYPFSTNLRALLYGLDSAGLCSIIGSLASVINLRLYVREYPGKALAFIKTFTWISLVFFAVVVIPQLLVIIYF